MRSTIHSPSDERVLRDSIKSPWMFAMLLDRYQNKFLRKATYILRSKEGAEDAVQETFLKIYKYAPKFTERRGASFNSWAYKILTNTCYDYVAKASSEASRVKGLEFSALDTLAGTDTSARVEQVSLVRSILSRMPEKLSRLLRLYFFEDKSYEEIAKEEKLSLSAVKSGLHRAKAKFRNIAIEIT
jgi:RNA polymerase sigma-70 factor, ECF subfamily